ncbi:MAG: hypothetical protein JNJ45_10170 [Chthonomonas sp.]|nr:hypothetical protein [Chthonomonas sp.]
MTPLFIIQILTFTYPPPIPDGPNDLLGVTSTRYSLEASKAIDEKQHPFSRSFLDSIQEARSSTDGSRAYVLRRNNISWVLDECSSGSIPWRSISVPITSLEQVSFDGTVVFGKAANSSNMQVAVSTSSGKSCAVPKGRLISTSSGTYVWPNSSDGNAFHLSKESAPRFARYVRKQDLLARLRQEYGMPKLSHKFIIAHPELVGGHGQAVFSEKQSSGIGMVYYVQGAIRHPIGSPPEGTTPYAIMLPETGHALISRAGEKIQEIKVIAGKVKERMHWIGLGGKFGRSWVMFR